MTDYRTKVDAELARLRKPTRSAKPGALGTVRFIVTCESNAETVLVRATSVLRCVAELSLDDWPSIDVWTNRLPKWFTDAGLPAMTNEEANRWLENWKKLTPEEQAEAETNQRWSLDNWLYWLTPENRKWFWWDAVVLDESHIAVAVEVSEWPFSWGALRWLFKAAGASNVKPEA